MVKPRYVPKRWDGKIRSVTILQALARGLLARVRFWRQKSRAVPLLRRTGFVRLPRGFPRNLSVQTPAANDYSGTSGQAPVRLLGPLDSKPPSPSPWSYVPEDERPKRWSPTDWKRYVYQVERGWDNTRRLNMTP